MNCDVCVAYVAISLRYGSRGPPRVPWSMWRIDQSINLEWRYSVSGDMHTILTMILTLEWSVHVEAIGLSSTLYRTLYIVGRKTRRTFLEWACIPEE